MFSLFSFLPSEIRPRVRTTVEENRNGPSGDLMNHGPDPKPASTDEDRERSMRVAVIGVGAIGSLATHSLIERGARPMLCVRTPFEALEVRGPTKTSVTTSFEIALNPRALPPCGLVVLATKAHQTASTADWLRRAVGPDSLVVVLQNGVEHEDRVRPLVSPGARIVPGIVDIPAGRIRPGLVVAHRAGSFRFPDDQPGRDAAAFFATTDAIAAIETRAEFEAARWRKLAVNTISGAIPTLTDRPAGVFREPAVRDLARALVRECFAVAHARGVPLPDEEIDTIVDGFLRSVPSQVNSMLDDRRRGRALEGDARNGAVARLGAAAGVPTPYNAMAATLLNALNTGPDDERE
jgi:2-dehydropantoate 2-reductase